MIDIYLLIVNNDIVLINKIFLYIFSTIFVFVALIGFVFYSNFTANNTKIIGIRNSFFSKLDSITPKGLFIYKARPISYDGNKYVYKFPGKFQKIDFDNSTITLKDLYGKSWTFKYFTNKKEDGSQSNFGESIDYQYSIKKKDGNFTNKLSKIIVSKITPSTSFSHFAKDDVIVLFWSDSRSMSEIYKFSKEGGIIDLNGAKIIQINKIVWE